MFYFISFNKHRITIHEEELYKAWNNAVNNINFSKIVPLQ